MEKKIKHLEMIQSVIERMGNNSFFIKGWSITLVSAIFVVAIQNDEKTFTLWALFPAIIFWFLDGFYLRQERLLRVLYDHVRKMSERNVDFSMDTSNIANGETSAKNTGFWHAVFSKTLLPFHGGMTLAIAVAIIAYFYL